MFSGSSDSVGTFGPSQARVFSIPFIPSRDLDLYHTSMLSDTAQSVGAAFRVTKDGYEFTIHGVDVVALSEAIQERRAQRGQSTNTYEILHDLLADSLGRSEQGVDISALHTNRTTYKTPRLNDRRLDQ